MTNQFNTLVPAFKVSAPELLDVVDSITDLAMQSVEAIKQAISAMPAEAQPILMELLGHLRAIGCAADSTVADSTANLAQVWGLVTQAGEEASNV